MDARMLLYVTPSLPPLKESGTITDDGAALIDEGGAGRTTAMAPFAVGSTSVLTTTAWIK